MPTGTTTSDEGPRQAAHQAQGRARLHGTAPDTTAHTTRRLTEQFTASPKGARLARRFAERCMAEWGHPVPSDTTSRVALVVGELAANAAVHARVPGRTFSVGLTLHAAAGLVRIEVADAAAGRRPPTALPSSTPDGESGRGLLLVDALAMRWGSVPRQPLGKTVWAEVATGEAGTANR